LSLILACLILARVGGFHMQEELLIVIKLDASSRKAGALKGVAIPPRRDGKPLITQQMETLGEN
jgi:hypothetical protein